MSTIRFTAFFKDDDGNGWSETHDKDGGSSIVSLTAYLQAFDNLMKSYRRPLLGGDAFYIGCRASYKTANGAIAGDNILLDPPMRGVQTSGGVEVNTDASEVAVKIRFRNEASTAKSDVYIRGMWRQVINAGVLNFGVPPATTWKSNADLYTGALISNGYGWLGVDPTRTSRGKVTGYTNNTDGTVTLNVSPTNGIAVPGAGTKLPIKFARINRSKSILNKNLVCVVDTGAAAVTTTEQIATAEFQTDGTYIATITGFIPYAASTYFSLARRKTGKVFGQGPGRLRAAVLQ